MGSIIPVLYLTRALAEVGISDKRSCYGLSFHQLILLNALSIKIKEIR